MSGEYGIIGNTLYEVSIQNNHGTFDFGPIPGFEISRQLESGGWREEIKLGIAKLNIRELRGKE